MKRRLHKANFTLLCILFMHISSSSLFAQRQMEKLDRGLVAVNVSNGVFLSWRMFGTDPRDISFNIYRNGTLVNQTPITGATNIVDSQGGRSSTYTVRPILNGVLQEVGGTATVWASQVLTVNLQRPSGGSGYSYSPNDISVGDVDGDGQYELILKWDPSNAQDNSRAGTTGNVYIDCYKLNGTRLWRLDLGRNIRAGAHYTQFLVGDYDGDGKAEVAMKTAPGTVDGTGRNISMGPAASANHSADYRNSSGYILSGPEYLTIFNGETGAEMATVNYNPPRGTVSSWGDNYGNRVDRFNATNAYLDGVKPSMIFQRGYYTRMVVAAWDWNGTNLTQRWVFDSNSSGNRGMAGNGNHSIMAADGDGDGFDEIYTGSGAINHDGSLMWTTGLGHGDANHIGDFNLNNPGLEIWQVTENRSAPHDHVMLDASTGRILWGGGGGNDNGRGMIGDIDGSIRGQEAWSNSVSGTYNASGNRISTAKPSSANFRVYWDGDLQDELLNSNRIDQWNSGTTSRVYTLTGNSCNGTKSTPNLSADILGDWREEVILHDGGSRLYIHTTTTPTTHKMYTLMHDPLYRNAISWQQSSYNQPPHLGFYLGDGVANAPIPNIVLVGGEDCNGVEGGSAFIDECGDCVGGNTGLQPCVVDCNGDRDGTAIVDECGICSGGNTNFTACTSSIQADEACEFDGITDDAHAGFNGNGFVDIANELGASYSIVMYASEQGNKSIGIRYANGSANNRPMLLRINNIDYNINFPTTGAWNNWQSISVELDFATGGNLLVFESLTAEGGPNLDQFMLYDTTIVLGSCSEDCTGEYGGLAFVDECGNCTGGDTGELPCSQDCTGEWGGTAYIDNCNTCVGGSTGLTECVSLQSELVCDYDGEYETTNSGYTGTGYVNTDNSLGASISFKMTSNSEQNATLSIRYANGAGENRPISIDINGVIVIENIDFPATASWTTWDVVSFLVPLQSGSNDITFIATNAGGIANVDMLWANTNDVYFSPCELLIQQIELQQGWNLISTNIRSIDSSITTLFADLDVLEIKTSNTFWHYQQPAFLNSLKTITPGSGYLVYMNTAGTLSVAGSTIDETLNTTSLQPINGWQLMGCPFQNSTPFSDYYDSNNCEIIKDFNGFWSPNSNTNSIELLIPGKGYFIKK